MFHMLLLFHQCNRWLYLKILLRYECNGSQQWHTQVFQWEYFSKNVHVPILSLLLLLSGFSWTGPDYDIDAAAKYIQRRFQHCNRNPKKEVYPHFTTATDTGNMEVVFQVVTNTIVKDNLEAAALMWHLHLTLPPLTFVFLIQSESFICLNWRFSGLQPFIMISYIVIMTIFQLLSDWGCSVRLLVGILKDAILVLLAIPKMVTIVFKLLIDQEYRMWYPWS